MILLIDNYDSFTFNVFQALQSQTDEPVEVVRNDALDFQEIFARSPSRIVISPGPGSPSNPADFGVCASVIERFRDLDRPILGVCLGHQGIAHCLGGSVVRAPCIMHGKMSEICVTHPSRIFEGVPPRFHAMRYHSLIVSETDLPSPLRVTARDAADGLVMALECEDFPMFGVQFHPESIGTPEGKKILSNFLAC
jgi:anthranilate synthase component II